MSSSGNLLWMTGLRLNRLPKQRSALRKPGLSFDFPPQRGGLGSFVGRGGLLCGRKYECPRHFDPKPDKLPAGLTQARRSRQLLPHYGSTNEQGCETQSPCRLLETQERSRQEGHEDQEVTSNRGPNAAVFILFRRSLLAGEGAACTVSLHRPPAGAYNAHDQSQSYLARLRQESRR